MSDDGEYSHGIGSRHTREIIKEDPGITCDLCKRTDVNSTDLGMLLRLNSTVAHYYCLLFASGLSQNGMDFEGIRGFLTKDIDKEVERGKKLRCGFCRKNGATIGCVIKTCRSKYHLPCALRSGVQVKFMESHATYCPKHRGFQNIPTDIESTCLICHDNVVVNRRAPTCIILPCCGLTNRNVFHRTCLSAYASSSGNCFKCPLCNKQDAELKEVLLSFGVNIPNQDASWEMDDDYYADLYVQHDRCDMPECRCPHGREFDGIIQAVPGAKSGPANRKIEWFLIRCQSCGSKGAHIRCIQMSSQNPIDQETWECDECEDVNVTRTMISEIEDSPSPYVKESNENDEPEVDVEANSSDNPEPNEIDRFARSLGLLRRSSSPPELRGLRRRNEEADSTQPDSMIKRSRVCL